MVNFIGSSSYIFSNNNVTPDICSRFLSALGVDPYQSFNFTVHDANDLNNLVNTDNSTLVSILNDDDNDYFVGDYDINNFRNIYNVLVANNGQYDTLSILADYAIDGF